MQTAVVEYEFYDNNSEVQFEFIQDCQLSLTKFGLMSLTKPGKTAGCLLSSVPDVVGALLFLGSAKLNSHDVLLLEANLTIDRNIAVR